MWSGTGRSSRPLVPLGIIPATLFDSFPLHGVSCRVRVGSYDRFGSVEIPKEIKSSNQRTRTAHSNSSYCICQYDTLGQVTSGKRSWADRPPVAGRQFESGFDDIGNRQSSAHGGNAGGSNLRGETYIANDLSGTYALKTDVRTTETQ